MYYIYEVIHLLVLNSVLLFHSGFALWATIFQMCLQNCCYVVGSLQGNIFAKLSSTTKSTTKIESTKIVNVTLQGNVFVTLKKHSIKGILFAV